MDFYFDPYSTTPLISGNPPHSNDDQKEGAPNDAENEGNFVIPSREVTEWPTRRFFQFCEASMKRARKGKPQVAICRTPPSWRRRYRPYDKFSWAKFIEALLTYTLDIPTRLEQHFGAIYGLSLANRTDLKQDQNENPLSVAPRGTGWLCLLAALRLDHEIPHASLGCVSIDRMSPRWIRKIWVT